MEFGSKFVLERDDSSGSDEEFDKIADAFGELDRAETTSKSSGGILSSLMGFLGASSSAAPSRNVAAKDEGRADADETPRSYKTPVFRNEVHKKKLKKQVRTNVDTNVVSVSLDFLANPVSVATGDAIFCEQCQAALTSISLANLLPKEGSAEYQWNCEFCSHINELELQEAEKPSATSGGCVDYVTRLPPASTSTSINPDLEPKSILFLVDVSGSMCVTTAIQGKLKMKGDKTKLMSDSLREHGDGSDQHYGKGAKNVTYISRLQAVQTAVASQLEALSTSSNPHDDVTGGAVGDEAHGAGSLVKVGLIAFHRQVDVIGDGSSEVKSVSGDHLSDYDWLMGYGERLPALSTLSESKSRLETALYGLEEGGPTALGPAVILALGMLRGKGRGSRIVLCTDGIANIGLGSLDEAKTIDEKVAVSNFYRDRIGQVASDEGIVIDVVGIEGDTCDLENLGRMAEMTGGQVTRVNPLTIRDQFKGVIENALIATNVSLRLFLHKGLSFKSQPMTIDVVLPVANINNNDGDGAMTNKPPQVFIEKFVGNATAETSHTFEYGLKSRADRINLGIAELNALPFQLQIRYTRLNGVECMRVMSQMKPVTRVRMEAEREMNGPVLSSHAAQVTAQMASKGEYGASRVQMRAWGNMMNRAVQEQANAPDMDESERRVGQGAVQKYMSAMQQMDDDIAGAQAQELDVRGRAHSDEEVEESNDLFLDQPVSQPVSSKPLGSVHRQTERSGNDSFANRIQKTKVMNKKSFL